MLDRYELYIYKQWLRVYMRSKMIKHNKDLFEFEGGGAVDVPRVLSLEQARRDQRSALVARPL